MNMYNDDNYFKINEVLNVRNSLLLSNYILNSKVKKKNYYDFSKLKHCPPFGALILSYAIRRLKFERPDVEHILVGDIGNYSDYAEGLGLFRESGFSSSEAHYHRQTCNHIPITKIMIDDLYKQYGMKCDCCEGAMANEKAKELTSILIREGNTNLLKTIQYCIREILRNIFEHASTDSAWICGQYWPSKKRAEIAILDEGIGIKNSLSKNKYYNPQNDKDAILKSLEPGVSCMYGVKQSKESEWNNSGYGLYMTKSICSNIGRFMIISGKKALFFKKNKAFEYESNISGTSIYISIDISKIPIFEEHVRKLSIEGEKLSNDPYRIKSASKSSLGLI